MSEVPVFALDAVFKDKHININDKIILNIFKYF